METALGKMQFKNVHSQHQLNALYHKPVPGYRRVCDICGYGIQSGWYFQCAPCQFDSHFLCAVISDQNPSVPPTADRAATAPLTKKFKNLHSQHPMTLLYQESGYGSKRNCDVCGLSITSGSYYQCAPCDFDSHNFCAVVMADLCPTDPKSYPTDTKQFHRIHGEHPMTLKDCKGRVSILHWCDVCGQKIKGLYYKCARCNFDSHLICAIIGDMNPSDPYSVPNLIAPENNPARGNSTAPANPTASKQFEPIPWSTPSADAASTAGLPRWRNALGNYTAVASALSNTVGLAVNVGKGAVWLNKEGVFDHGKDGLFDHGSGSAGDTSNAHESGAWDTGHAYDSSSAFDASNAADTSGAGFDFGGFFDN